MRMLVAGAGGQIGREVVRQALRRGHVVTAPVRHRGSLAAQPGLTVVEVDLACNHYAAARHMGGQNAVISSLGNGLSTGGGSGQKIMRAALSNVAAAMRDHGVLRLVVPLTYGAGASRAEAPWPIRLMTRTVLRSEFDDQSAAEAAVAGSGLDWTVAYFAALRDGQETGSYDALPTLQPPRRYWIRRADVAHFLLGSTETQCVFGRRFVLSGAAEEFAIR